MAQPWSDYNQVVVETYFEIKSGKSSKIHVRPIPGQIYPTTMDVECSRTMRKAYPIGTKFKIYAKETDKEGGSHSCILISIGRLKLFPHEVHRQHS